MERRRMTRWTIIARPKAPLTGNKKRFTEWGMSPASAINKFKKKHKNYTFEDFA